LDVVLAQQHRELRLQRPEVTDLRVVEVRQLEGVERTVRVLLQDQAVEDADEVPLDQVAKGGGNQSVEPASRELSPSRRTCPSCSGWSTVYGATGWSRSSATQQPGSRRATRRMAAIPAPRPSIACPPDVVGVPVGVDDQDDVAERGAHICRRLLCVADETAVDDGRLSAS
jgi:hypothetical protein